MRRSRRLASRFYDSRHSVVSRRVRRDETTANRIANVWQRLRYVGNLVDWDKSSRSDDTERALVVGDGLQENGFSSIGTALIRFAKRMQKWRVEREKAAHEHFAERKYPDWNPYYDYDWPVKLPKWSEWKKITERVDDAIGQISRQTPRAVVRPRPQQAVVTFHHKMGGPPSIEGPYPIRPEDAEDLTTLRAWLKRTGAWGALGRATMRRERSRIIVFPQSSKSYDPHSIVIDLGQSRQRLPAREIGRLADILRREGFAEPNRYARRLYRARIDEHRLQEMLWAAPTSSGSVEQRFGFRLLPGSKRLRARWPQ